MKELTVAGTTYQYPESGEDPNWSSGAGPTEWAEAMTDTIATFFGPGDILETTFSISNNISSPQNVNGLLFDSGTVRGANISYTVYRTSTLNPSGHAEIGTMSVIFDDSASVGEKWSLVLDPNGSAGVLFDITDAGQIVYTSSDIGSAGYSGTIHFKADALLK